MQAVIDLLEQLYEKKKAAGKTPPTIVWRTSGYYFTEQGDSMVQQVKEINRYVLDQAKNSTNSAISYVDWAKAIEARSFGKERIQGDVRAHYGVQPRLVLLQMLTNCLVDKGFFSSIP